MLCDECWTGGGDRRVGWDYFSEPFTRGLAVIALSLKIIKSSFLCSLPALLTLPCCFHLEGPRTAADMSEGPKKTKYSATRRLLLKTKMLKKASAMLVAEEEKRKLEREQTLNERVPALRLSGLSVPDLQNLCKELHQKIDVVDEARYDIESKVAKNENEIQYLSQKIFELKGKMKRPNLKRVKKSADDMLGALADNKLMKADFKANLKTVKKEEEKKEEVTDWRKNVEAMSGMEGRKKLFNAQ
nr:troponin I, slow skeletal muscle-like isoform X2 [Paramormyrops kingsleyae]